MEDAKLAVIAGYRQVLEDGPDVCDSESEAHYSYFGEELSGMYTSEMLGPDGKPSLASARMTTGQANMLCATAEAQKIEKPMAIPTSRTPTPVLSDDDDVDMSEDQRRLVRRFSKTKKSDGTAGSQATVRAPG
jgi:hypothetical protein